MKLPSDSQCDVAPLRRAAAHDREPRDEEEQVLPVNSILTAKSMLGRNGERFDETCNNESAPWGPRASPHDPPIH